MKIFLDDFISRGRWLVNSSHLPLLYRKGIPLHEKGILLMPMRFTIASGCSPAVCIRHSCACRRGSS